MNNDKYFPVWTKVKLLHDPWKPDETNAKEAGKTGTVAYVFNNLYTEYRVNFDEPYVDKFGYLTTYTYRMNTDAIEALNE